MSVSNITISFQAMIVNLLLLLHPRITDQLSRSPAVVALHPLPLISIHRPTPLHRPSYKHYLLPPKPNHLQLHPRLLLHQSDILPPQFKLLPPQTAVLRLQNARIGGTQTRALDHEREEVGEQLYAEAGTGNPPEEKACAELVYEVKQGLSWGGCSGGGNVSWGSGGGF